MTPDQRRIDILRQLALSPNGLRTRQIVGCSEGVTAGRRIAELLREGMITETPVGNPCSTRHRVMRYAITAAGRLTFADLETV